MKFKASLKQTNKNFKLTNYTILIWLSVLDEKNNEVKKLMISSEIENGVLSLAEEETLFGLKRYKFDGYKLIVKEYTWYPLYRFKPNKS